MYKNDEQEIIFKNSAVDSQGLFVWLPVEQRL